MSVAVAEHGLLPALRETPQDSLVVADGFSCRGQIGQLGGREALHTAQVVQLALRQSGRTGPEHLAAANGRGKLRTAAAVAAGAGAAVGRAALLSTSRRD